MSLIRARRSRKKNWIDVKGGPNLPKLILLLIVVLVVMWFLDFRF